jgi:tRNA A-37 threonylcarbamoyl transferase component Bud32
MIIVPPRRKFRWVETGASRKTPPLAADLAGWQVQKRRPSHWNAARSVAETSYFLKWFFHGPWSRPALVEWRNARRIASLGIPTVLASGWGIHPRGTFIVLEGSPGVPGDVWIRENPPRDAILRHAASLAAYSATLHDAGLCHKDLNVYHVLVTGETLRVIDVGRAARFVRRRWIMKDLASLLASARREGFPSIAARHFLRRYLASTKRPWSRRALLRAAVRKAGRYDRRHRDGD